MTDEASAERGLEPIGQEDDDILARYAQLQNEGVDREAAIAKVGTEFGRDEDEVSQLVLDPQEVEQMYQERAARELSGAHETPSFSEAPPAASGPEVSA